MPQCGQNGSPPFAANRIAAKRACASSSLIRMMSRSESVRATGLKRKCCDMGPNPLSGSGLAIAVEIERQLDYIPGDDHDGGA
jgi:hypothetical protein